ncbi:MAG: CoB--CoM heterodisulfide reductase subunit B [Deltaproteobacteria bacterium]|nr:CoB--CoM heterodisulfide reductase subunit B [Deltaproteobacteria bacterium]
MTDIKIPEKRYAFFLGCLIPARFPRFEYLARVLFPKLGVELVDIEGFSCCPDPVRFKGADQLTWIVLAARNLALAQQAGLPIITICPTCAMTLMTANHELQRNPDLLRKVNGVLEKTGRHLDGPVEVKHFMKALYEDLGTHRLRDAVERPLSFLHIAYHGGCHENNPVDIVQFDNPFNPRKSGELLEALGAHPVDYLEIGCCGSPLSLDGKMSDSHKIMKSKTEDMVHHGAGAMAVGCASCFQQFEIGQTMAIRGGIMGAGIPVFHFLELMGLAMGLSLEETGLGGHKIKNGKAWEGVVSLD